MATTVLPGKKYIEVQAAAVRRIEVVSSAKGYLKVAALAKKQIEITITAVEES